MSYLKNARTKASLIIFGDRVFPDAWALYFERSPDEWAFRDEPVVGDRHFLGPRTAHENFVAYIAADPRLVTIDEQVARLCTMLRFPRHDFKARIIAEKMSAHLKIDVNNRRCKNLPVYGAITERFLAETGASLDLQIIDEESLALGEVASEPPHDYRRTRASLTIRGDHVDAEAWAMYFGLAPVSFAYKGEYHITPSGRPSFLPSKTGRVHFECRGPDMLSIDAHVSALRFLLGFPRSDFVTRLADEGSRAEIWVFVENDDGTNPPVYGPSTQDFVAEINAELILDVYPDAFDNITFIDDD